MHRNDLRLQISESTFAFMCLMNSSSQLSKTSTPATGLISIKKDVICFLCPVSGSMIFLSMCSGTTFLEPLKPSVHPCAWWSISHSLHQPLHWSLYQSSCRWDLRFATATECYLLSYANLSALLLEAAIFICTYIMIMFKEVIRIGVYYTTSAQNRSSKNMSCD